MTGIQLLPTRPVAPSSMPAAPALFAVSTVTMAVTGVALLVIFGFGAAFLASQNRRKDEKDREISGEDSRGLIESHEEEGPPPGSPILPISFPDAGLMDGSDEAPGNCQVIMENLARYAVLVPDDLAEAFVSYNQQVTSDNIMEAAQLLHILKGCVNCISLSREAEDILQVYGFNEGPSFPIHSPDYSGNPEGVSDRQLISQQNRELEAAQIEDVSRKEREEKKAREKEEQEAKKEEEKRAEEEKQQRLEKERLERIAEYKKNPVNSCETLIEEVQSVLGDLKYVDSQLKCLQGFCKRYKTAKNIRQILTAKDIQELEENEKSGFNSSFIKEKSFSQYPNKFQQRYEEVLEALPQAKLFSDLFYARKNLISKYDEYAKLIESINSNASAYSKWKRCRQPPPLEPLLPLEKDKRAN